MCSLHTSASSLEVYTKDLPDVPCIWMRPARKGVILLVVEDCLQDAHHFTWSDPSAGLRKLIRG